MDVVRYRGDPIQLAHANYIVTIVFLAVTVMCPISPLIVNRLGPRLLHCTEHHHENELKAIKNSDTYGPDGMDK